MSDSKVKDISLHEGMTDKAASAKEPMPKGGAVNSDPTRSKVGEQAPTIGPRCA